MDKAKGKVSEFLGKSGKHDTTVHESVAPAVTHQEVKPHHHENVTTAVDREVHQDHHHTSVQPVHDRETLPEQHHYRESHGQSKEFNHGNSEQVAAHLAQERAKHKDAKITSPTTTSQSHQPTVAGEHVHHHVHENIQPVVHKETVEPHVVHSVNKVHEKHHNPAQMHDSSTLPAMNMSDFKSQGGHLTGREERMDAFDGCPRGVHGTDHSSHDHSSSGLSSHNGLSSTTGHTAPGSTTGHSTTGHSTTGTTGKSSFGTMDTPKSSTSTSKPSMTDKLNPKIDADGDGKAGIMS